MGLNRLRAWHYIDPFTNLGQSTVAPVPVPPRPRQPVVSSDSQPRQLPKHRRRVDYSGALLRSLRQGGSLEALPLPPSLNSPEDFSAMHRIHLRHKRRVDYSDRQIKAVDSSGTSRTSSSSSSNNNNHNNNNRQEVGCLETTPSLRSQASSVPRLLSNPSRRHRSLEVRNSRSQLEVCLAAAPPTPHRPRAAPFLASLSSPRWAASCRFIFAPFITFSLSGSECFKCLREGQYRESWGPMPN